MFFVVTGERGASREGSSSNTRHVMVDQLNYRRNISLKDPLAGREVTVEVEGGVSLRDLRLTACRELEIRVPSTASGSASNPAGDPVVEEFLQRVVLSAAGKQLVDDSDTARLEDCCTLVCFVRPRLVQQERFEADDVEVDEDEASVATLFRLNPSVPPRIREFLLNTCKIPEWLMAPLTHIRLRQVALFALWIAGSKAASAHEMGPPYLLATLFGLMFTNFSKEERRPGEWSAYSLFNRGVRRLGGDNLRADVRRGGWFGL